MLPITNFNQLGSPCFDTNSYSSDDEKNSHGSDDSVDFVFDIISHSTDDEDMPITKPVSKNYFQINGIVDCCTFSCHDLYLTSFYKIYIDHRQISCNRKIVKLFVYDSHLYGLDKYGVLHILLMHYYESNYWVFKPVDWSPKHIIHVSVTLDGLNLWLQTAKAGLGTAKAGLGNPKKCYLYDNEKNKIVYQSSKRIYGKNKDCYLEIKNNYCLIYINNEHINTIPNVVDAVLDTHHGVHVVYKNDQHKKVRLLNHEPYFIN